MKKTLPFYTSASGYISFVPVCVPMHSSGVVMVLMFQCMPFLMKGDNYDDSLSWPFNGRVTIELLNQLEHKNHHKWTIPFPADDVVSERVVDGERGLGYGRRQFISHADLAHKPRKNIQYLKDDTLVFQVSTEAPDYKPWRVYCTL